MMRCKNKNWTSIWVFRLVEKEWILFVCLFVCLQLVHDLQWKSGNWFLKNWWFPHTSCTALHCWTVLVVTNTIMSSQVSFIFSTSCLAGGCSVSFISWSLASLVLSNAYPWIGHVPPPRHDSSNSSPSGPCRESWWTAAESCIATTSEFILHGCCCCWLLSPLLDPSSTSSISSIVGSRRQHL